MIIYELKDLAERLDKLTIDKHGYSREHYYMPVAEALMNKYAIVSGKCKFRICEIEIYHYNESSYPDPYAHRDKLQRDTLGKWYIHRSGMDITFGNGKSYNGILLRAILNVQNDEYIYGPINLRKALFAESDNITQNIGFYINEYSFNKEKIYAAKRYGLNRLKDTASYHDLKHRLYIKPNLKHPKTA